MLLHDEDILNSYFTLHEFQPFDTTKFVTTTITITTATLNNNENNNNSNKNNNNNNMNWSTLNKYAINVGYIELSGEKKD